MLSVAAAFNSTRRRGIILLLLLQCLFELTEARPSINRGAFCSLGGELLISSLQAKQATAHLFDAFCSRRDVQSLIFHNISCSDYAKRQIQGNSQTIRSSDLDHLPTLQTPNEIKEVMSELLSGTMKLSHGMDEVLRIHNFCECPLVVHQRLQCTDQEWIPAAPLRYCSRAERFFRRSSGHLSSMATLKHQLMIDHALLIPPMEARLDLPAGWPTNTNARLVMTLTTLYSVMEQARTTLKAICSICSSQDQPLCQANN